MNSGSSSNTTERELVSSRVLNASRQQVFRAFKEPQHLARRWGPKDFRITAPLLPMPRASTAVRRLLVAIADGMTNKAACIAANIGVATLRDWRHQHPDLEARIEEAREKARQKALQRIKVAGEQGDWRADAEWLKLTFPQDYRRAGSQPQPAQQNHLHVHGDTGITLSIERQQELREQSRRIKATTNPEPANERRTQPTGLLVRPEERERSEAEAQPVQEAEVIERPPAQSVRSGSMLPEPQSQSEAIQEMWRTYQRNGSDDHSGNDDVPRLR